MLLIGRLYAVLGTTSMKALPKRKGNTFGLLALAALIHAPQ